MGCCKSQLTAKLVLPHELRIGDHILIKNNCCKKSVDALYIADEQNRCVYLDGLTGFITETYLSTLCTDRNRLYRYDYSTTSTMSPKQTVANARYFASRGKFSKSCFSPSGYQFIYNCKINKYTSSNEEFKRNRNEVKITQNDRGSLSVEMIPKALKLCMDHHRDGHVDIETSSESTTSNTNSAGSMNKTSKTSIETQVDRENMHLLLQKLKTMDAEIQSMKKSFLDQQDVHHEHGGMLSVHNEPGACNKSLSTTPNLSVKTMDTSITLTPIKSETGNPGGNASSHYGRNLGIIVAPDINASSSVGGQFSVVGDTSMSLSTTKC